MDKKTNLELLKKEIQYKFKPQSIKFGKAIMVAYIDARDAQDLLDEVVGPENWQTDYKVINENLFCGVGIRINDQWVWKYDCGVESNQEAEKGESSDAFKRACVQWGIGRFLYRLGIIELPTKEYNGKEKPATHTGKILWSNDEISDYIRSMPNKNSRVEDKKPVVDEKPKYEKKTKDQNYTAVEYSEATIKRVTSLEYNGVKGKECLLKYLPEFNKKEGTTYKKISDLDNDPKLNALMDFITNLPPANI